MRNAAGILAIAAAGLIAVSVASAAQIETVTVGNPGNPGTLSGESVLGGFGPDRICGAVGYVYDIGRYEVTAGQYAAFLNAVAATDTYGLYNTNMWESERGCRIQRSGTPGGYTYSVASDWANRPVNYVSWGDAARFANWLHNGQPTGLQGVGTTEDGSYALGGAVDEEGLMAIARSDDATFVIPSEDEWYKSAYYYGDAGIYFRLPFGSISEDPSNELIDPDPGYNATFYDEGYTIGSPYFRTEVGAHEYSMSPYGTYDQCGNVYEWNEAVILEEYRGARGGSFFAADHNLGAEARHYIFRPTFELDDIGFRIALVPEPTTLGLLALGGIALLRRRTLGVGGQVS